MVGPRKFELGARTGFTFFRRRTLTHNPSFLMHAWPELE